jgi:trk system potassium uptake protein TrkH
MNLRVVSKYLSLIAVLVGGMMVFSLPWATATLSGHGFEQDGFIGLLASIAICWAVAAALWNWGRGDNGQLFRKEAMAVVGLSWVLATILGALPFLISGTERAPGVRMNVADALFESQSGFSTTGATVITDLENTDSVPRSILFWRSSTHFLGGLGIIVLFVAILGQGSAGKTLMRAEMPGPTSDTSQARMQHTAWAFASIYVALNVVLTVLLRIEGMSWFNAICHAFGTMATGGFSTYNDSLRAFGSAEIEWTVLVFMILAGTNFTLLYVLVIPKFGLREKVSKIFGDVEYRVYLGILVGVTAWIIVFGLWIHDDFSTLTEALRYGSFQVVSIVTTTGFGTHDFDQWNDFGRGMLFLLMFVGGCAGSTGGGMKVIRHILFLKIMRLEIERSFHPNVVRPLRLGGQPLENKELRNNILVYFCLILVIFVFSWMALVTIEPDSTWGGSNKLIDSATGIAATLNNIGPGLGTIGATQNYAHFTSASKILFTWLMMLGRLEIFVILVLFMPAFWRTR